MVPSGSWTAGNSGGAYGYKPYVMSDYAAARNPLTKLNQYESDLASARFRTKMAVAAGQYQSRAMALPAAMELVKSLHEQSSTIAERDAKLSAALEQLSPGASGRVEQKARVFIQHGHARTTEDALAMAIATEMSPLGNDKPLGDSVVDWFARHTSGGGTGSRVLNTFVDWHCSPASTAVGSLITSIWTGPAGGQAAAAGATQMQQMAGCDDWNLAYSLGKQLGVSREVALSLIRSGAYVQEGGVWVKATWWTRTKPFLPWVGLAALAYLASR